MEPTAKNIIDGKYKMARPFLYLTKGEPKGEVKKYIDLGFRTGRAEDYS